MQKQLTRLNVAEGTSAQALTVLLTELRRSVRGSILRWVGLIVLALALFSLLQILWEAPSVSKFYLGHVVEALFLLFWLLRLWRWKPPIRRQKELLELVPSCLWGAQRADLPLILEVAGELLPFEENVAGRTAKAALTQTLTRLLPSVPVDELLVLTPLQRKALRCVTLEAIDASRREQSQETLAVVGLLALGSLKDTGLIAVAAQVSQRHTRGHVSAAAEEYLAALR